MFNSGFISAADYEGFLENLHRASSDVESSCALSGVEVVVQPERMGFGFAVKRAVEDFVATPYIMVVHHDQRYRRSFPLASVVAEMEKSQKLLNSHRYKAFEKLSTQILQDN